MLRKQSTSTIFLCAILFFVIPQISFSQNLENIGKQKPVSISGSVGASANFYNSNEPTATQPPFGWNIYANLTPVIYGLSLPFSVIVNQYGNSFQQPFTMFGLSPTYKWIKLDLGYRTMEFSPVTFSGQSFRGVGLELTPGKFRFGAFYGKLNRKVNEDTTSGRFQAPQFSRIGYGAKLGYGTEANHIDLIYFHAKDDSTSSKVINKLQYTPQENTVLGTSFRITLIRKIIFSTDVALSGLTQDLAAQQPSKDTLGKLVKLMKNVLTTNSSSIANWAGQSTLQFILKGYTTSIGYRRVQPNFKSLGTPYMLNDIELLNWMNNFSLDQGKLNITVVGSGQRNDLDKSLPTQLQTLTGTFSLNALVTKGVNLNFNYNGYLLTQKDGTTKLTDSTRMHQLIHNLSFTPSYTFLSGTNSNTISASANYMLLKDMNPVTSPHTNSNNLSGSLNYTLGITPKSLSFTLSGLYNQYLQDTSYNRSYGGTISSSAQVLKDKSLSLQGSVGYLFNKSSFGNAQSNMTFGCNIGYHKKHHSFSLFANYVYTPYNPINNIIYKNQPQAVATKNLMGGISYNYSF